MASRGSSRSGTAASTSPSGSSVGRSLRECTARSARPSRSASSISFVKRPLVPTLANGTSVILSPVVLMISMRHWCPSPPSCASTQRACQSASCDPRDAMTSMSVLKVEHLSYGRDHVRAFRLAGLLAKLADRAVRNLIHDAARERVERLFLLRCQRAHAALDLFQLADPDLLELFLQADDGWCDLGHLEARHHALDFFGHHLFGVIGFFRALAKVRK